MEIFFVILIVVCALLLMGVVLIQNAKGGGLASNVGISTQMLGGVKKATDGIEKLTWGLMIALFVLCVCSGFFFERASSAAPEETQEVKVNDISDVIPQPVANQPIQGLQPQQQPVNGENPAK